ncbi:MAG: hypothetical protein ACI9FJ_000590 [Alteromonadaceae bacterium]|jgi:hypothetical protein
MSELHQGLPESLAEQAFVALQARRGLACASTEALGSSSADERPLMIAEILHYILGDAAILGNANIDIERVSRLLGSNLSSRRTYNQLLSQARCAYAPREAHAQDNDEINQRIGQGFTVQFKAAKNHPGQVYIIIELDYHNLVVEGQPLTLHINGDDGPCRLDFAPPTTNKSQLIVASTDLRLLSLSDLDTELSLV